MVEFQNWLLLEVYKQFFFKLYFEAFKKKKTLQNAKLYYQQQERFCHAE